MIGAFNSVYTALQGFFSRSFWFGIFLPVALFAVLHGIVAALALGPVSIFGIPLSLEKEIPASVLASAGPTIIVILVVISYALTPLMPRFRGLLDGSLLPTRLHDWLRRARQAEADATRASISASLSEISTLQDMNDDAHRHDGQLRTAYRTAETLTNPLNRAAILRAEQAVGALKDAISKKEQMTNIAIAAESAVLDMLRVNNPNRKQLVEVRLALPTPRIVTPEESVLARHTNEVCDEFEGILADAVREANYQHQIMQTRIRVSGALEYPRATLVGDARFVVEQYTSNVYHVDFNYLWPRLLVAMKAEKADDPMLDTIEMASSKVDFAVLSLVLAASIPAAWLPALLVRGGPTWLFLAIGAATPPVLVFFNELVFESQLAFGDVIKAAVDKSRFLVLKMLRLPEPASRSEERRLWTRIAKAEEDARQSDLIYLPPSPSPK
jgi:hypothetical protein